MAGVALGVANQGFAGFWGSLAGRERLALEGLARRIAEVSLARHVVPKSDAVAEWILRAGAGRLTGSEATSLAIIVLGAIGSKTVGLPGGSGGSIASGASALASAAGAGGGSSQGQLMQATQGMQEMQMSFNMQYLQSQNSMQNDNRQFTMVSNIMKTKHDTVKNTISNIH